MNKEFKTYTPEGFYKPFFVSENIRDVMHYFYDDVEGKYAKSFLKELMRTGKATRATNKRRKEKKAKQAFKHGNNYYFRYISPGRKSRPSFPELWGADKL